MVGLFEEVRLGSHGPALEEEMPRVQPLRVASTVKSPCVLHVISSLQMKTNEGEDGGKTCNVIMSHHAFCRSSVADLSLTCRRSKNQCQEFQVKGFQVNGNLRDHHLGKSRELTTVKTQLLINKISCRTLECNFKLPYSSFK